MAQKRLLWGRLLKQTHKIWVGESCSCSGGWEKKEECSYQSTGKRWELFGETLKKKKKSKQTKKKCAHTRIQWVWIFNEYEYVCEHMKKAAEVKDNRSKRPDHVMMTHYPQDNKKPLKSPKQGWSLQSGRELHDHLCYLKRSLWAQTE